MKNVIFIVVQHVFLRRVSSIILFSCILFIACSESQAPIIFSFNEESGLLSFHIDKKLQLNNHMEIYWKDSLLCSPRIEHHLDTCFVDIYSNISLNFNFRHIDPTGHNSCLTELCYYHATNKKFSLRCVLKERKDDRIFLDTVLYVPSIVKSDIINNLRATLRNTLQCRVELKDTGFQYFIYYGYDDVARGRLYEKGIRNVEDSIIRKTAILMESLVWRGKLEYVMRDKKPYSGKIPQEIPLQIYSDSIKKVYLVLTSLSGKNNCKDFMFDTKQEITEFIGYEYSLGFKNGTLNNFKEMNVPIKSISNHKYNFIQVLFAIGILPNNDYKCVPVGYVITRSPSEMFQLQLEGTIYASPTSYPSSCLFIDDFIIVF